MHHIVSLDQLADPEKGKLYLFSLQVCDDALAGNTLHGLVDALSDLFTEDFQARTALNEKLAARGYLPTDRQAGARPLRILAERLYRVDNNFPRLLRTKFGPNGIPNGVEQISYKLDLAACANWIVATHPQAAQALFA